MSDEFTKAISTITDTVKREAVMASREEQNKSLFLQHLLMRLYDAHIYKSVPFDAAAQYTNIVFDGIKEKANAKHSYTKKSGEVVTVTHMMMGDARVVKLADHYADLWINDMNRKLEKSRRESSHMPMQPPPDVVSAGEALIGIQQREKQNLQGPVANPIIDNFDNGGGHYPAKRKGR